MTVNSYGVTIVEKEAFIEGEENGLIRIICDGERYEVKYLLVCTGSDTVIPPIPGLSEVSYWTSKEALEIKRLPETLVGYRWWSHRNGVCFFLQQYGSESACCRDDAGDTGSHG